MPSTQAIAILGSTGSIGTSCLDVLRSGVGDMRIAGLAAGRRWQALARQIDEFCPDWAVLHCEDARREWHHAAGSAGLPECLANTEQLTELVRRPDVDTVVSAIVGAAGLHSTWAAVDAGKRVGLANKEALVVAGGLMMKRAEETGAEILPVDSEHSAIFQCLQAGRHSEVRRVVLTASGGPFRGRTQASLQDVTPDEALAHPTWDMGRKISIDSATMMNKALEIIEARWLFDLEPDQISVVVHPQSIIHSFVEFADGSVICQLSPPDMKLPIQYALTFPDRISGVAPRMDWTQAQTLELEPPDIETFPALRLGMEAAAAGGTCGCVLNAANEVAVDRFLGGTLRFTEIAELCEAVLNSHQFDESPSLRQLDALDRWARKESRQWIS